MYNNADKIRELIAAARHGDGAALEYALELLRPCLLRIIARRVPDVAAREDIAQETLIKILRALPLMPPEADPYAYFLTMAKNAAVDHIRKQAKTLASENIDMLANELLDAQPADNGLIGDIIDFVACLPTAPYRLLVYFNNRFIYPARHGMGGRHRGYPKMILDELGGLRLDKIAVETFMGLHDEFEYEANISAKKFRLRLLEKEKGIVYAEMLLSDTLGNRPIAIISMWTDRINKQVMDFVANKKIDF